jgi:glycosyltransferase involved in cell wall biosynthesis
LGLKGRYLDWRHAVLRRLYLRSADRVITVSEFGKWELVELLGVPEARVEVTYLAADEVFTPEVQADRVEATRARYGLPVRYLLFVGGFEPRKNVLGLIKAHAEARKGGVKDGLVLIGIGGDRQGAQALATDIGLEDGRDIVFLERVHEDLPALYHGATAFITLSWGESFCLPAVEAMSCGIPVIASNLGALPEIVADGGILVNPRDHEKVVQTIQAVSSQNGLRAELRSKALSRASAFSWRRTAERTLTVYEGLLANSVQSAALSK